VTYSGGGSAPTAHSAGPNNWPVMNPFVGGPAQLRAGLGGLWPAGLSTPVRGPGGLQPPLAPSVTVEALRQQAAALLQRCYHWLEAAVPVAPQVAWLVPALVTAVQQYEAQQYQACLAQTLWVIQAIGQLQAAVPILPPL
jgi:hypothetical protein